MSNGTLNDVKLAGSLWMTRMVARAAAGIGDLAAELDRPHRQQDPYPLYDEIRRRGPWYRSRLGFYVTASHDVVSALERHPDMTCTMLGGTAGGATSKAAFPEQHIHPLRDSLAGIDAPDHTRLRRIVAPLFTRKAVAERRRSTVRLADELVAALPENEPFDLVERFAVPFPVLVICEMFGLSKVNVPMLAEWGRVIGATADGVRTVQQSRELQETLTAMERFFSDLLEDRRHDPGGDIVSTIVQGSPDDCDPKDLIALAELLFVAGFETLTNFVGTTVLALLDHPEQLELFRADPDLAPRVVDESLRFEAPVQTNMRGLLQEAELPGGRLPAGKPIIVLYGGANRDPAVFEDPNRFDITRTNSGTHMAFGAGPHYCLGAALARLEGESALRALFGRFSDLRQAGPVEWYESFAVRGAHRLPLIAKRSG